jgi:hypothetical protein
LPRDQSGSFPKTNGPSRPIYNGGKIRARSETLAIVAWVNSESAFKSATEGAGASEAYRYSNIFHTIIAVRVRRRVLGLDFNSGKSNKANERDRMAIERLELTAGRSAARMNYEG